VPPPSVWLFGQQRVAVVRGDNRLWQRRLRCVKEQRAAIIGACLVGRKANITGGRTCRQTESRIVRTICSGLSPWADLFDSVIGDRLGPIATFRDRISGRRRIARGEAGAADAPLLPAAAQE